MAGRSDAEEWDKTDSLAMFRQEFYIPPDTIYLNGNSLGLCSRRSEKSLYSIVDAWKEYAVDGWTEGSHPWFYLSESLGMLMAEIVGASGSDVIVTGSTTVNLHQMITTFYKPAVGKNKILSEGLSFPTDIYALKSQLRLHGLDPSTHLVLIQSKDGRTIDEDDIIDGMTKEIALVILPTVLYRGGQRLDIERLTHEAHRRDIVIGFDACHSVGIIPHYFDRWGVDFAVWCTYKYLNGGPGSAAALYVNKRHRGRIPGLPGWFSSMKEMQFEMGHELIHAQHAGAFQMGTPHILSAAPLMGSLELIVEATVERIHEKSLRLTRYMMDLITADLEEYGFHIGNPLEDIRRGGHISLEHEEAVRICKALKQMRVIPDFRKQNGIRLSPNPLYTSFVDVYDAIQCLKMIMVEKRYEQYTKEREVIS